MPGTTSRTNKRTGYHTLLSLLLAASVILCGMTLGGCNDPEPQEAEPEFYLVSDVAATNRSSRIKNLQKLQFIEECNKNNYICVLNSDIEGDFVVPSEHEGRPVELVTAGTNYHNKLTSLTVPEGVRFVEFVCSSGSYDKKLRSLSLPAGVTVSYSFGRCSELKEVDLSRVERIQNSFGESGLTAVTSKSSGGNTYQHIEHSFTSCDDLTEVTLNDAAEVSESFSDCKSLTSIRMDKADTIGESLNHCPMLTGITMPSLKTVRESFAFDEKDKDSKSLTSVKLPAAENIWNSFNYCRGLETAELPAIKDISMSFNNWTSLRQMSALSEMKNIDESFIYCPALSQIPSIPELVRVENAFQGCDALTGLDWAENVQEIEASFKNCKGLKTVDLKSVTSITGSFTDCSGLEKISAAGKQYLDVDTSFRKCPALTEAALKNARKITESFTECGKLRTASFSAGDPKTTEDEDQLNITKSCTGLDTLETVSLHNGVSYIGDSFNDCPRLGTLTYDTIHGYDDSFENCPAFSSEIVTETEKAKLERERKEEERKQEEARKLHEMYDDEPYGPGTSRLHLSADSDKAACFRLVKMNGDTEFMEYLEPGESITKTFPEGRYTLKVAKGDKWISDEEAFGSKGHYSTTDVYTFEANYDYEISAGTRGDFRSDSASGFTS